MGFLSENIDPFTAAMQRVDEIQDQQRPLNKKADTLAHFALSIKARAADVVNASLSRVIDLKVSA